jgi:hypothetical protein
MYGLDYPSILTGISFSIFVELLQALRYLRRIAAEESGEINIRNGQHPAVLRTLSQRLAKYVLIRA